MQKTLRHWLVLVVITGTLLIGGCFSNDFAGQQSSASPSPTQTISSPTDQGGADLKQPHYLV
ncbi:hypothetical protein [Leptothermofonsia sp. ETS-13]|uniref:hypothetical protein n=1 Tax=Leptothermofonsia sp. ETS-13 TaxID=3035696 RepID=UPI003BA1A454